MKVQEERTVTQLVTVDILCDLCGHSKKSGMYEHASVTINAEHGEVYPEGGFITAWKIDCCIECFQNRVRPAIESLDVKFRETEVNV